MVRCLGCCQQGAAALGSCYDEKAVMSERASKAPSSPVSGTESASGPEISRLTNQRDAARRDRDTARRRLTYQDDRIRVLTAEVERLHEYIEAKL
jgi:hypothetical protein